MPSVRARRQLRESAANRSSDGAHGCPHTTTKSQRKLDGYFWYKSTDGVDRLAASCSTLSEVPRHVNDYTFDARRFANHPYPTTFPPGAPWPPRTAQHMLHALGTDSDDCVGNACYTSAVCGDGYCNHTFEDWKRVTDDWQDHFELRKTGDRGIGVHTKRAFEQDDILGWYAGNIIPGDAGHYENAYLMEVPVGIQQDNSDVDGGYASSSASSVSLPVSALSSSETPSYLPGEETILIDGNRNGNWTRFINHSCEPYCEFQIRRVGGMRIMAVVATRDIAAGVEVTVSYGPLYWNSTTGKECHCRASNCVTNTKTETREQCWPQKKKRVKKCTRDAPP